MSFASGFSVVTSVAEALKVFQIEGCTALVDGADVVDHLCRSSLTLLSALLAERLTPEFLCSELAPRGGLIELRIGVDPSCMRFMLRLPRTAAGFLERRHGQKMMSGYSGRS